VPAIPPLKTTNADLKQQHFTDLVHRTLATIDSKTNRRVYRYAYSKWLRWCNANEFHPTDLRPGYVLIFLNEQVKTKVTRQAYLAALRKLAQTDYLLHPSAETHYAVEALQTITVTPLPHFK
jgi:hypothetical protein